MTAQVAVTVDGHRLHVVAGTSVAAAVAHLHLRMRRSCSGMQRSALCGMGVCYECRVTIDGLAQQQACMIAVREGMQVHTDD